jgi:isopentenyl-diphosphate delta-isomerase
VDQSERNEEIILVDENDNPVGFETKIKAHEGDGELHRAFSIFIFNAAGKVLLQRRAKKKYHFGGLWTNACCGHPTASVINIDPIAGCKHINLLSW